MVNALELTNLKKTYPGGTKALKGIDLIGEEVEATGVQAVDAKKLSINPIASDTSGFDYGLGCFRTT